MRVAERRVSAMGPLSGRGIPRFDLAQGAGSKSGLRLFLGLAGAIISISPYSGSVILFRPGPPGVA